MLGIYSLAERMCLKITKTVGTTELASGLDIRPKSDLRLLRMKDEAFTEAKAVHET